MKAFARRGDFWSGLALAALGAYVVSQALQWPYMTEDGPGPGFFPRWYGSVMVLLSLWLVVATVMKPGANMMRSDPDTAPKAGKRRELARALVCWAAFVVSIALMPLAGFLVAFALLTWFIVSYLAGQSRVLGLALGIGGSLLFYLVFELALGVELPHGLLF
jgi:putative tricarboxylic transport membrane protein